MFIKYSSWIFYDELCWFLWFFLDFNFHFILILIFIFWFLYQAFFSSHTHILYQTTHLAALTVQFIELHFWVSFSSFALFVLFKLCLLSHRQTNGLLLNLLLFLFLLGLRLILKQGWLRVALEFESLRNLEVLVQSNDASRLNCQTEEVHQREPVPEMKKYLQRYTRSKPGDSGIRS